MRKVICPITKKEFNCQNCTIKDERCPYFEFDKCIDHTLKFIRELVDNEKGSD